VKTKVTTRVSRRALLAVALPALTANIARAQSGAPNAAADAEDYPDHAVTFIVPFAPAGGTDILTHLVAAKLEQQFNKPFVVENRPGGATVIATNFVAKSPPDGYTIMMSVSSLAIDATLYKTLPYDPGKDLALVALIATVPFRGSTPALNDLMGGYIQLMFTDLGPALPLINAGKIRALAVTTKQRLTALPDVPPLDQAGVPGYDAAAWQGVVAPAQTPRPILGKLNTTLNTIVAMDDVTTRMTEIGMNPVGSGSIPELQKFLQSEIGRWGKVVETAGIAHSE
jgi:tripartite-type tricarboxylate transporter receptor subunit TctC